MNTTIISGSKNISAYLGLSWPKIREFHRDEGLPLAKAGRKWLADQNLIAKWMQRQSNPGRQKG